MLYYVYDGTFEGFLTAVFDAYHRKETPVRMVNAETALPLFTDTHPVVTDDDKAGRVLRGLEEKISQPAIEMLYVCHLSELPDVELMLLRYIRKALASPVSIEVNFADDDVLALSKIYKKVSNERTHLLQFVRFQKAADGMYFALTDPMYNVLPLCAAFFQDRYADQRWLIYDSRRRYGLYYDLTTTETIRFERPPVSPKTGRIARDQQDDDEKTFQDLWKDYLQSITIQSRKNLRLQRQFMPQRFWKYLIEK
jgi:probable DNA metabolism protein